MTNDVTLTCDQIKEIVVKTKGTPTQKLLAILTACGLESSTEMAEMIGILPRAVRKARAELQDLGPTVPGGPVVPQKRSCSSAIGPVVPPRARVEDNNILTIQVDRVVSEVSTPLSPPEPIAEPIVLVAEFVEIVADAGHAEILPVEPPKPKPKPRPEPRGSRLPEDWVLPDEWRTWTLTNCLSSNPEAVAREGLKFANHWQSKPGAAARKVNWYKTWQNWSMTAFANAPVRPRSQVAPAANARIERTREFMAILNSTGDAHVAG